jgi:hypothetical protein
MWPRSIVRKDQLPVGLWGEPRERRRIRWLLAACLRAVARARSVMRQGLLRCGTFEHVMVRGTLRST